MHITGSVNIYLCACVCQSIGILVCVVCLAVCARFPLLEEWMGGGGVSFPL